MKTAMKDADCTKVQDARCAAVVTLRNIPTRAVFRLWHEWTEERATRRARRMFELEMAWFHDEARSSRPFFSSPCTYYAPSAASAALATRRRRTKQTSAFCGPVVLFKKKDA